MSISVSGCILIRTLCMTENKLILRLLRVEFMQLKYILNVSLLLSFSSLFSQPNKISSIEIANVQSAYVDRPGDLYILQNDNTLKKFDIHGKLVSEQILESP